MARFKMISNLMARRKFVAKRFVSAAFFLSAVAMSFKVLGIIGPSWVYVEENVDKNSNGQPQWSLQEGIWLAHYCDQYGRNCHLSYRDKIMEDLPKSVLAKASLGSHWLEFQIMSVVSLLCNMIIVISLHIIQRRKDLKYDTLVLCACTLCSILSCITLLIPVIRTWYVDGSSVVTSWARSSAAVGTIVEFVIVLVLVYAVYQARLMKLERDRRHERRRREMTKRVIVLQGNENPRITEAGWQNEAEDNSDAHVVPMAAMSDTQNVETTTSPSKQSNRTSTINEHENDAERTETERHAKLKDNTTDNTRSEDKQLWDQSFLEDNIEERNIAIVTNLNVEDHSEDNMKDDTTDGGNKFLNESRI